MRKEGSRKIKYMYMYIQWEEQRIGGDVGEGYGREGREKREGERGGREDGRKRRGAKGALERRGGREGERERRVVCTCMYNEKVCMKNRNREQRRNKRKRYTGK